jgi:hypothetical protein
VIYSQYSFSGNLDLSQFDPEKDSVGKRILSFTMENPGYVANFVTAHFLNTEIGGLLALPLIKPFNGFQAPVNLYWVDWNGSLEWYNIILVLIYLAILAIGFGASWRRLKWLALTPLAFNLGYALSNGISRFSSWRYNFPVDWVIYFYFGIGVVELLAIASALFSVQIEIKLVASEPLQLKPISFRDFKAQYAISLFAFVLIGALPWLAEGIVSPRYSSTREQLISKLEASGYVTQDIQTFLAQPNTILIEGRLLYPRMYRKGEGLSSTNPWPAYAEQNFARIGFLLINNDRLNMIFPTRDVLDFPQGADAIVLACSAGDFFTVRVIDFGTASYQSGSLTDPCP